MVLDESTLERMLAAGKAGKEFQRPPAKLLDANDEFEVYERAAPPGEREVVREEPGPDLEEYPPRRHPGPTPGPQQDPALHAHAPTQVPEPPAAPAPEPSPPAPEPNPSAPEPKPPAPEPVPQHPAATASPTTGPQPSAPAQQPPVAQPPAQAAQRPAPPRPQVFSLNRSGSEDGQQNGVSRSQQPSAPSAPAAAPAAAPARSGGPARIALVQADYNADVTDLMAQWAVKHAHQQGAEVACHLHVPGVFDTPLAAKMAARRDDVDAVVVVGAVVQGETGHDELIAREAARLLADLAYHGEKPVGLGIAGPRMTLAQAEARIKMGRNAVESVLRQLQVLQQVA